MREEMRNCIGHKMRSTFEKQQQQMHRVTIETFLSLSLSVSRVSQSNASVKSINFRVKTERKNSWWTHGIYTSTPYGVHMMPSKLCEILHIILSPCYFTCGDIVKTIIAPAGNKQKQRQRARERGGTDWRHQIEPNERKVKRNERNK